MQVPANDDHPSHPVAGESRGRRALPLRARRLPARKLHSRPERYADAARPARVLRRSTYALQVYPHRLSSRDDVVEWVKGTMLLAYQKRLSADLFAQFLDRFRDRPFQELPDTRPFFYPFKRILFWGQRKRPSVRLSSAPCEKRTSPSSPSGVPRVFPGIAALSPAGFSACGPAACLPSAPPAASASASASAAPLVQAEPPEGPVAALRSGELAPIDHKTPAQARVVARYTDDRFELLALELVLPINAAFDSSERQGSVVRLEPRGEPYAFAAMPD